MARDPETFAHQEWLGFVQPEGLVVSIPALLQAQAHVNRNIGPDHQRFLDCLAEDDDGNPYLADFPEFTRSVLGWEAADLVGSDGRLLPDTLEVALPEYNETLRPTYAVPEFDRERKNDRWIMLIKELERGADFEETATQDDRHWQTTPQARFERLLRETQVPIGLLTNGTEIRLVYTPRGETSGHATFRIAEMAQVAGRSIFAALHMLLCSERLFSLPDKKRLPGILADSRKYQNLVSTKLAQQILAALYELLRGFQAANDQRKGELLRDILADDPNHVSAGLLTVFMRIVFLLYAEDRGLLSSDPLYANHYSVHGLFERLRADAGRFPDTMDQRYGAWAQLLVLFRLIYDGGSHGRFHIPGRKGYLFDPDRYPFLEGRPQGRRRSPEYEKLDIPRVSDGVIFRVLNNLLVLDGERLSYRTLDVEQIGSVYEAMMGFDLEVATGPSIAIKPTKKHGAPATIDLDHLLAEKPANRAKWLRETTEQKITGKAADALKQAETIEDLLAALDKKIAHHVTPNRVPKGAMVLQPSDERRRSGSHYTPRSLTEPIVRKTLEPILRRLALGDGESGKTAAPTPNLPSPISPTDTEVPHGRSDSILSRPSGLADGHGPGGELLRGDEDLSARGDLRSGQPDSSRRGSDPGQYRGRPRPGQPEGVPPVSAHGTGEPARAGNAPDSQPAREPASGVGRFDTADHRRPTGPNAPSPAEIPPNSVPTPQRLTPISQSPTPEQILNLKICDPAMGSGAFLVEAARQLGDALVKAWVDHDCVPKIPPDEDELLHARRIIAQRCLYGVDKNPMAVDLAKLSLWLATLARDHPFTFLDHALRCGDSLVGLTREQIANFHWEPLKQRALGQKFIEQRIERATSARKEILDAGDSISPELKTQKLVVADDALDAVRFFGDLCIAAFFAGKKDKQRKEKRDEYLDRLNVYLTSGDMTKRPTEEVDTLRYDTVHSPHPISPFHWEIEYPEVFSHDDGGFDAFVGNPPFLGGKRISTVHGNAYRDWLAAAHHGANSNTDIVAHFFRHCFNRLCPCATLGLIATNTIAQGDTREGGLYKICTSGGNIYHAIKRYRWPGAAAVIVSVIHIIKGPWEGPRLLDAASVNEITAYLFHTGGHSSPRVLEANKGKAMIGFYVLGMGFTFDDTVTDGSTNSLATMNELISDDEIAAEAIRPYIGGEELNTSPSHAPHRYVIYFAEHDKDYCGKKWPRLMQLVEEKVRPYRTRGDTTGRYWWRFARTRPELAIALSRLKRVLVRSRIGNAFAFALIPSNVIMNEKVVVFPFEDSTFFAVLQSRVHEAWAIMFSSTLKDDLQYTPSDCFETFAFPKGFETDRALGTTGGEYYEFRADLMVRNDEGLTKTYNRFHDPHETSPDILKLRELHAAMDRAVLDAYGWSDVPTDCGFALDYLDIEDEDELPPEARERIDAGDLFFADAASAAAFNAAVATGRKRLPWRYRWPDDVRDDVLARLLDLNAKRAEQERLAGKAADEAKKTKKTGKKKAKSKNTDANQPGLFEEGR